MILILVFLVLILSILYSWIKILQDWRKQAFDGPFPLPVVGSAYLFWGNHKHLLELQSKLAREYNNAYCIYNGSNRYLVLSHPRYLEFLMTSQETISKGVSYEYLHPWLGLGLLTSTGDRWKFHRKLLEPAFHFAILQKFLPIFTKNCDVMMEKLRQRADGTTFDLFQYVALAALDNVAESIMGVSIDAQSDFESEFVKAIRDISEVVFMRTQKIYLMSDLIFSLTPHKNKHDKALNFLHEFTDKVIETRRKELQFCNTDDCDSTTDTGLKNKRPFLDLLLLSEKTDGRINNRDIIDEVNTFMFEGMDTTTAGILFSVYCVSKHPEVQQKLVEEQKTILGSNWKRNPDYNELSQMKYLECVIRESLRLYPPVPFIERKVTQDIADGALRIKKNTSVIVNILELQRHPDLFEDPLEFRPERFETSLKNSFSWLAFSAGPRNCIGQKFAMLEMKVTISSIIKQFEVLPSNIGPELNASLVLKSENGFYIKLLPR